MKPLFFEGMNGLGINIYQRTILRYYPGAYICTAWPELYSDLEVQCGRSDTTLRTQHKNEVRTDYDFHQQPKDARRIRICYGSEELANGSIIEAFRKQFGVSGSLVFDLQGFNYLHRSIPTDCRLAVIRPATVRTE